MINENLSNEALNPPLRKGDVSTRSSCMSCFHCKVMQGKLSQPMSFLCFKGEFGLTNDQTELKKHQDCTMFLNEC